MKTFTDLIDEVQKPGLCHRCGGCVTFCTSINYGALKLGDDGSPQYADREKCIECGLCYSICPEIDEYQEETRAHEALTYDHSGAIGTWTKSELPPGQALREPAPLFKKLDESVVEEEYTRLEG